MRLRMLSVLTKLGFREGGTMYSTMERQIRQTALMSLEERFAELQVLNAGWTRWARFYLSSGVDYSDEARSLAEFCVKGEQNGNVFDPVELAKEVSNILSAENVRCAVGGSLALYLYAPARMTKDVDFNVDADEHDFHHIERIFTRLGHSMTRAMPLSSTKVLPKHQHEKVYVSVLTFKGVRMDLFFNTCRATQMALDRSTIVSGLRFIAPESLAHFKLFSQCNCENVVRGEARRARDYADLALLATVKTLNFREVEENAKEVWGEDSCQVKVWKRLCENLG